ncbi:universal stress protein [Blastococcus brunescens]|uniref:Universal stress protein n=1 Tax=Blastococcus brunescens TaxID=1564165 RepID=A0ABZ1B175_9ACTN|nr:universal stress protein [Blastococcus sp. BMG 8361]WRL64569.1 universal stress protein [Blastococcus sp. BMG 8361]
MVGVDGSECGLGAVRWAVREAARRGAPLRILHAAPYLGRSAADGTPPPELHRARRITAQAYTVARHTDAGVPATTEVVPGDPTSSLLRAAASARLVVLGSSATGAADEFVRAPVAVHVAARSPQPVVVVPRRRTGDVVDRPVAAVLGVGDRDDDEAVATIAAEAAGRSGVGLVVLQTRPPKRAVAGGWVDSDEEWQRRYPELRVSRTDLPAPRGDQLLGATCPAPLLVISAGSGSLLHRDLDGPHRWLLRHCTSPMVLVPPSHRRDEEPREEIIAIG